MENNIINGFLFRLNNADILEVAPPIFLLYVLKQYLAFVCKIVLFIILCFLFFSSRAWGKGVLVLRKGRRCAKFVLILILDANMKKIARRETELMTYAEVRSIMVLGDSVSKGVVYNDEKNRYVFSREGFISKLKERICPEVLDFSKYGSTTSYGKAVLAEKFDVLSPDLVLIEYGSNDCDYRWDEVAEHPDARHMPNVLLSEYTANIAEMIALVRAEGKLPVLTNLHPLCPERYFAWFTQGLAEKQQAIMRWLKSVSNIYWWQEMYSYAAERTAIAHDVKVVNIRAAFLRQQDYRRLMCDDGIHPNEAGHRLLEDTFMEAINRVAPDLLARK